MTPLEDAQARLRYVLDLRTITEPVWTADRRAREDLLRWCLWQVGVASGALVLLGAGMDTVASVDSWLARGAFVASIVSFIAVIMVATWAHRWHVLLGQKRAGAESAQALMFASPGGKDGSFSPDAHEQLLRSLRDLNELLDEQKGVHARVHALMTRQDFFLYGGLVALLLTVLETARAVAFQ